MLVEIMPLFGMGRAELRFVERGIIARCTSIEDHFLPDGADPGACIIAGLHDPQKLAKETLSRIIGIVVRNEAKTRDHEFNSSLHPSLADGSRHHHQ